MDFNFEEGYTYIPKFKGNREKPKAQQVSLEMVYQGGADMINCMDAEGRMDQVKEWLSICKKVNNLNGNGKKITPEDIANIGFFQDLYVEAKADYHKRTKMSEEDKKK